MEKKDFLGKICMRVFEFGLLVSLFQICGYCEMSILFFIIILSGPIFIFLTSRFIMFLLVSRQLDKVMQDYDKSIIHKFSDLNEGA